MAVSSVVLRVSGVVSLSDDTIRQFLGLYDQESNSVIYSVDANTGFRANFPSKKTEIEALAPYDIAQFPTRGQIVAGGDPADEGLVVTSLAMVITGRVAEDDDTYEDFSYEVRDDGSVYNHTPVEGNAAWEAAFGFSGDANTVAAAIFSTLYSTEADPIAVSLTT